MNNLQYIGNNDISAKIKDIFYANHFLFLKNVILLGRHEKNKFNHEIRNFIDNGTEK